MASFFFHSAPSPDFETVRKPNPEEPECFNLAKELAVQTGAKLIFLNDPDADRFVCAELRRNRYHLIFTNYIHVCHGVNFGCTQGEPHEVPEMMTDCCFGSVVTLNFEKSVVKYGAKMKIYIFKMLQIPAKSFQC